MVRASACHAEGREFESRLSRGYGVSPSWLRPRTLDPRCEGSNPSTPNLSFLFYTLMSPLLLLETSTYISLFTCVVASLVLSAILLTLSYLLAIQTPDPEKTSAYECGFEPFEDARNRFDVRFYIVAILFLIFDLEVAFLFPWAATLGSTGGFAYTIVVAFLLLLTAGFLYEVVKGALQPQ